jgi:hypothetical protein
VSIAGELGAKGTLGALVREGAIDEELLIRGHDLITLVSDQMGFTAIADLLWLSPVDEPWPQPEHGLVTDLNGVEGLRSLLAAASASDPLRHDLSPHRVRAAGRRMITAMALGMPQVAKGSDVSLTRALWRRPTSRRGSAKERVALDVALALLADHGLVASTFAAASQPRYAPIPIRK